MARRQEVEVGEVVGKCYWREREARTVVEAWRQSGQSLSRFAREQGVRAPRILRWAARLEVRPSGRAVDFQPVRLIEAAGVATRAAVEPIEVVLSDGRRVRVPEGFAAAELARVLAVLEGRAAC